MANSVIRKGWSLWIENEEEKRISKVYRNLKRASVKETKNLVFIYNKKSFYTNLYVININTGKVLFETYTDYIYPSCLFEIIVRDYTFTIINTEFTNNRTNYEIYDYNGNLLYKYSVNDWHIAGPDTFYGINNLLKVPIYGDKNVFNLIYKDKILKENVYDTLLLSDQNKIIITNDESISIYDINTMECLKEKIFSHDREEYKCNKIQYCNNIIIVSFYDIDNYRLLNDEVLYADTFENVLNLDTLFYRVDFELDYSCHDILFYDSYISDIINITLYDNDIFENILGKKIYNFKLKKYISDDIYDEINVLSYKYLLLKKGGIITIYTRDGEYIFSGEYRKIELSKSKDYFIVYTDEEQTLPGIIALNSNVKLEPINLYKITEFRDIRILA